MLPVSDQQPVILSIIELGGYPDFSAMFRALGFQAITLPSMRKALKFIKINHVDVIVAEFNFQSDFRDRTSQLESLMASIAQRPQVKVIVLYDRDQSLQFSRVTERYQFHAALSYPIVESALKNCLLGLAPTGV